MPAAARQKLQITQQARPRRERVRETYKHLGVDAEIQSFFADLPMRIAQAHLVISRAGASTVSELGHRAPAILVPLPGAIDQDQAANAEQFAATGAAIVVAQGVFRRNGW